MVVPPGANREKIRVELELQETYRQIALTLVAMMSVTNRSVCCRDGALWFYWDIFTVLAAALGAVFLLRKRTTVLSIASSMHRRVSSVRLGKRVLPIVAEWTRRALTLRLGPGNKWVRDPARSDDKTSRLVRAVE